MPDTNADIIQSGGSQVAVNPGVMNFTTGLKATLSGNVLTVEADANGTDASHMVIAAGIHDWAGGAATTDSISVTGLLSTDVVQCTLVARASTEELVLAANDDGNDQIDLTLSANGTNTTTKVAYTVLRAVS